MEARELQHLYLRAGFGCDGSQLNKLAEKSKKNVVQSLFKDAKNFNTLKIDLSEYDILRNGNYKKLKKELGQKKLRDLQKKSRKEIKNLNVAWIERMQNTDAVLLEKMTLFWANVFVCREKNIWFMQQYNNVLRQHALGNFREFVKAISKEPAMLNYLNNKQNKKKSPNENFARELMELFTLGVGNYTEKDIKEAARAFTGWSYRKKTGSFHLEKFNHDEGQKTFMGKTGNFGGEEIIDLILEQRQCAQYICEKIYCYFVNPIINENHLELLTTQFHQNYDIENLMRTIFLSDWFYDNKNQGVKIKSPVELLVGIHKTVPFKMLKPKQAVYLQKMMGQILLEPVNVAGWKGGRNWIDSNTLMFRMKLPSILLNNAIINLDEKGDIEGTFEEYYKKNKSKKRFLRTHVDWNYFEKEYKNYSVDALKRNLIISPIDQDTETLLSNLKKSDKKDFCIQLMSIPEYQLC
ncbi:MAG: DUF1800 domain-containing protein [Flavicella sp.]